MKIYTKKGDRGQTALYGGTRVLKNDIRIEAYGTVDELNSYLGLIRDQDLDEDLKDILLKVQEELFTLGSHLAADPSKKNLSLPDLDSSLIDELENRMDRMEMDLPPLKYFILPGGHIFGSYCHIARCVCRRAERLVVALDQVAAIPEAGIVFLNRLSDFLFMLSRKMVNDNNGEEIYWKPREK